VVSTVGFKKKKNNIEIRGKKEREEPTGKDSTEDAGTAGGGVGGFHVKGQRQY